MKSFVCRPGAVEVETDKGTVRGYEFDNIQIFKGIPYARAKRFHRPEPVKAWSGVLECTSYGYTCPIKTPDKPSGEMAVPHRYWVQNEDCQNLNIWTPGTSDEKRPVLVWLHGGGYMEGSSIEQTAYDGANLAKKGNAVVVSINHRLNVLGYFDLSDFGEEYENSGNAGGDDIIAALKWIKENIKGFGGDPDNVTVFGQSGGGAKVTTLLQSPEADGLFQRGIVMSGVIGPVLADSVGSGKELAEAIMAELGITDVKELETISYGSLNEAYMKVSEAFRAAGKYAGGTPHPNRFYLGDPLVNGFRQETAHVPLLVGSVFGEFMGFFSGSGFREELSDEELKAKVLELVKEEISEKKLEEIIALFRQAYPEHPLKDLLKLDTVFRGPEISYIAKRSEMNPCTYSYMFDESFTLNGHSVPWHCADIPYAFANCDRVEYTHQPGMDILEKQISDTVLAFARTGNPNNPSIPKWDPSAPNEENIMIFGSKETKQRQNYDHELQAETEKFMEIVLAKLFSGLGDIQH